MIKLYLVKKIKNKKYNYYPDKSDQIYHRLVEYFCL